MLLQSVEISEVTALPPWKHQITQGFDSAGAPVVTLEGPVEVDENGKIISPEGKIREELATYMDLTYGVLSMGPCFSGIY